MTSRRQPSRAGGRREARERAIELAYEAELRTVSVEELLSGQTLAPDPFVVELLTIAEVHRERAEAMIGDRATGWSIARMPAIDRLVMRMAVAELLVLDTPPGVVLSQAVELVSRYSTDESSRFVNGVLAAIARDLEQGPTGDENPS